MTEKTLLEMEQELRDSVEGKRHYPPDDRNKENSIKRRGYLLWHLGFWFVMTLFVIAGRSQPVHSAFWEGYWMVQLIMVAGQFLLGSMRIRDAGLRQWWVLTIFIPGAWVVWSCIPSKKVTP